MPGYEAEIADFERYDAQVVGISVDSVPSHAAFAKSLGGIEKYPLLADFHPKGEVSKKYGVWKEDKGICERAIVVVDKQGVVRYIDVHDISEAPENAQILEVLRELDYRIPAAGRHGPADIFIQRGSNQMLSIARRCVP